MSDPLVALVAIWLIFRIRRLALPVASKSGRYVVYADPCPCHPDGLSGEMVPDGHTAHPKCRVHR